MAALRKLVDAEALGPQLVETFLLRKENDPVMSASALMSTVECLQCPESSVQGP